MSKTIFPQLFLIIIYSVLIFSNLGVRALWQDEAETALVARQIVKSGVWLPYASDEQGPISQDWNYQFSVSPLWRWHPWLQFYLTAFSFKMLGISSLTARLPFAIIGIISYVYFIRFTKKHGPKNQLFQLSALALFLLSTPLLLHFRQCRYYALSVLFYLITIDGYLELLNSPNHKKSLKYFLGSIFLFHSFLSGALALQISFFINFLILYLRGQIKTSPFVKFITLFSLTLPFTIPWTWYLKIGGQNINLNFELIKQHIFQHYLYIHKYIFPFFVFIVFLSSKIRKKFSANPILLLFSIIIAINLTLYTFNHPYFFRYLIPLIPFFIYIISWILIHGNKLAVSITVFATLLMTIKTYPNYIYEITHKYYGTNSQLINYLNSLDKSEYQALAVNYDDFTFRFHTQLKTIGSQQLLIPSNCPDVIFIFPEWGNESLLFSLVNKCGLQPSPLKIPYSKLADDPNPLTHRYYQMPLENLQIVTIYVKNHN